MLLPRLLFSALCVSAVLGGCESIPSIHGDEEAGRVAAIGPETPPVSTAYGQPTGTYVGEKVETLRNDFARMQGDIVGFDQRLRQLRTTAVESATSYQGLVAAIRARLQVGTTPGNPILVQQWNQAQSALTMSGNAIAEMNTLSSKVADASALATALLDQVRATFGLPGAVEEDHRQLAALHDDINRSLVQIDRILVDLAQSVPRQTTYYDAERNNLTALAAAIQAGELMGASLALQSVGAAAPVAAALAAPAPLPQIAMREPLVIIRFDKPNVDYEQALYLAVSRALERRPNAAFEVVGVAPVKGTAAQIAVATNEARRHAEGVVRTLTSLGFPPNRVSLSSTTSAGTDLTEVHLFVR
jgi:hypothetical protein